MSMPSLTKSRRPAPSAARTQPAPDLAPATSASGTSCKPAGRPGRRDNVFDLRPERSAPWCDGAPVLSLQDLREISELRCELETMALQRSVARGGARWQADVLASARQGRDALHVALVSACENRQLLAVLERLREDTAPYRGLVPDTSDDSDDEAGRRALIDAAISGDRGRLVDLVIGRIRAQSALIARALGQAAPHLPAIAPVCEG